MNDFVEEPNLPEFDVQKVLAECVRIATGVPDAAARPGQALLTRDIAYALNTKTSVAGIAPTGTGKSLAALSAAAYIAVAKGQRTVVSTDSLALQAQYMDKDLPVVAEAVKNLHQFDLYFAVLKGVGNYADPLKTVALAQELTGSDSTDLYQLSKLIRESKFARDFSTPEGVDSDILIELVLWACDVYQDDNLAGDRHSCPIPHSTLEWQLISASSEEAAKEDDTGYVPKALTAREKVAEAHIVVTNHTLLGIQAAGAIPVVIGNMNLGDFDNIIVDEGHTLPQAVRAQGQNEVSSRTIMRAAKACWRVVEDESVKKRAETLAGYVDDGLSRFLSSDAERRVGETDTPLSDVLLVELASFVDRASKSVDAAKKNPDLAVQVKFRRAKSAVQSLKTALDDVSEFRKGNARWVTRHPQNGQVSFQSSPVNVAGQIKANLWTRPGEPSKVEGEADDVIHLGVAVISATLPHGFEYEVGIPGDLRDYESPFAHSYANSALYIAAGLADGDVEAIGTRNFKGEMKFDTNKHATWCANQIVELVEANQGSALVLAAKTSSGKTYVDELRKRLPQFTVLSQWDGEQSSQLVTKWREDKQSILVGTKSLMTGVDAPGETNTLVIIDRPPRSAKNAIDDARVEAISESMGGDKWIADRLVYVSDAALLLDQASGRLIRSISDAGLVAVLDPRLVKHQQAVFTYPEATRSMYMEPLRKFGSKMGDLGQAKAWLASRTLQASF